MDCIQCKRELAAVADFCPYCGASQKEKIAKPFKEVEEMFENLREILKDESDKKRAMMLFTMIMTCRLLTLWIYGETNTNVLKEMVEKE